MGDDRSSAGPSDEIALREIAPLTVRGLSLSVVVGMAALLVLREAAAVVVPALISLLLAYTLAPAVDGLTRWNVPRAVAAAIVYILLAVAAGIAWRGARDRIDSFLEDLPPTIAAVKQTFESGGHHDRSPNPSQPLR